MASAFSLSLLLLVIFHITYGNCAIQTKKFKGTVSKVNGTNRPTLPSLTEALKKDKKAVVNKKLKKIPDTDEALREWINEVDTSGLLRKVLKRKLYIPKDSSLCVTSQVSRPNIFPNIFNQGEGFIVDAVIEWPVTLNLYKLSEAVNGVPGNGTLAKDYDGDFKSDLEAEPFSEFESEGKAMSDGIIGIERCLIYDQVENAMSIYLDISRNQSHDCVLRAVCEAQQVAEYYPIAPASVFFEVFHLILKPSLSQSRHDKCYLDYLAAENAAYNDTTHCSEFIAKCPLNIAGLFVRNFFPEIL